MIPWIILVISVDGQHSRPPTIQPTHVIRTERVIAVNDVQFVCPSQEVCLREVLHHLSVLVVGLQIYGKCRFGRTRPADLIHDECLVGVVVMEVQAALCR